MRDNYCVIMGGGIGSRFWPSSRKTMPKQFLDFFGTGRSLIQQTFDRFNQIIPTANIFIATNEIYADLVKKQLPEITDEQILLEPTMRNTAPCIAYAAYRIRAVNPKANIVVTPADHLILQEQNFHHNIEKGLNFVANYPALVTLGVKPNRPETGYGYIQTEEGGTDNIQKVKAFTEKPNYELAKIFFESGEFFWNSGIFIWNVQTILNAFHAYLPDITTLFDSGANKFNTPEEASFIKEQYPICQNISIDYGVMEKADNAYMLMADFGWSDLGTWGSLFDLSEKDEQQNAVLKGKSLLIESANMLLTLPENKLAVIQGLDDYIVADSGDILLICKKSEEQRIKQFVTDVKMKYGEEYL
ncbi:mannose-1-phosphate guanylyltransferase [Bacteroidia bacterium]|nr:mannose-1-phosphate guanylyltransferase [Bacteroidia bacterium]GHT27203.1 mannose-1-phosphate guanylyltransferase [Bacteroidia bacterium]